MSVVSALTSRGLDDDLDAVDVGKGKSANVWEHLLARLTQHGLQRFLCENEEIESVHGRRTVDNSGDDTPESSYEHAEKTRAPYYYMCVPCELRLTEASNVAATQRMLEDAHYHFSSARHRRAASWMADVDIDATLGTSPMIHNVKAYTRIYINGVSLLLSRQPGGGDMFYPLPHERDRVIVGESGTAWGADRGASPQPMDSATNTVREGGLFPPLHHGEGAAYWYHPLRMIDTKSKQLLKLHPSVGSNSRFYGISLGAARRSIQVLNIPLDEYRDWTLLDHTKVPLIPTLVSLQPRHVRKTELKGKRTTDHHARRLVYTTGRLLQIGGQANSIDSQQHIDRCVIYPNAVYRVALRSAEQVERIRPCRDSSQRAASVTPTGTSIGLSPLLLSREMLNQVINSVPMKRERDDTSSMSENSQISSPSHSL